MDIDRLHKVIEKRDISLTPICRGEGKTYARVCELASILTLGKNRNTIYELILCCVTHISDITYIRSMITEVFEEYKIPTPTWVTCRSFVIHTENESKTVSFVTDDSYLFTFGTGTFVVPMGHKD